ncbi:HD domain-containing protein (plasmid) [Clostridium botulinum]|uniref:Polynucleotide adenylyltransferase n=1 Tax=Clostridium botulinum C/D str. DC5 TaxID=1443128 RepID=A0A0A0HXD5_CLOBO|nr:HD domain-containing protein [Clostridium botulinum]KGM92880.1 polynucleotide adenylyltransferase [Clostridium botulinum D str. CCUG 7971]KGM93063.1 polynucleotide adenylyltransferase [Clostridium botulinum C/D str. DC5]KOC48365.1 polynucleotide adenylyltransferase [Clostridium botulinum]KOC51530.1 polynucleotide adenylyltransferase [Clostridium botulinum]KOC56004.1 polynucleotide adenylyltransferase [Clostridium botulinum]
MDNNMEIKMPKCVSYIIHKLQEFNYEAYIVGGCVRDSLLKKIPNDWDITTSALPNKVVDIFQNLGYKIIPTGLKHGTVTIVINNEHYEVTTYRIDGEYEDNRHPKKVEFTRNLKEDLSRRDFTINSMAYNDKDGLVDYFNSKNDLESGIVKSVGDPVKRFSEDALRILRAYRFAAQLGFVIEDETLSATMQVKNNLKSISIERIRDEIDKMLLADSSIFFELSKFGVLEVILPELHQCFNVEQNNPYHVKNVFNHIINATLNIEPKLHLKLTMLLHDICKPQCKTTDEKGIDHFYNHAELSSDKSKKILKRMKYDNNTIDKVSTLVKYHDREIGSNKSIRKLLNLIGEDNFRDLLKVKEADIKAQNLKYYDERHNKLIEIEHKLKDIISKNQCFSLKHLKVNGRDLIELGYTGKEIGHILNDLLEKVLENPDLNNKDTLIGMIKPI